MFTTRSAATAAALCGRWTGGLGLEEGFSRQSGSGCTTWPHLPAAIPKVNFQEETQTDELLTLHVDLLESIGSPAGGTVQSKQTAYLLTLNVYFVGMGKQIKNVFFFVFNKLHNLKEKDFPKVGALFVTCSLTEVCGTPGYLAPEIIECSMDAGHKGYSTAVDM